MKTIEERAKESWSNYIYRDVPTTRLYQSVYVDGYDNGSTDQKQIDIDKACDILLKSFNEAFHDDERVETFVCCFRKLMEQT